MKKIILLSTVFLGIIFLTGCGQKTNQNQQSSKTPTTQNQAQNTSIVDISSWNNYDDAYISFKYPKDWVAKGKVLNNSLGAIIRVNNSNETDLKSIGFVFTKLSEARKDIADWYEFNKSMTGGTIQNERTIQIGDLVAKAFDNIDSSNHKSTYIVLTTQNYTDYFSANPSADDPILSKIISTVKINSK